MTRNDIKLREVAMKHWHTSNALRGGAKTFLDMLQGGQGLFWTCFRGGQYVFLAHIRVGAQRFFDRNVGGGEKN